jgi:hypothetical protein
MKKVCNQPAGIVADRREAEDFSDISIGRMLKSVKRVQRLFWWVFCPLD